MLTQRIVRSVCLGALFSIALTAPFVCLGQELDKATLAKRVMAAHARYEDALSGVSGYSHMQTNFNHSCTQRFDILGRFVRNINGPYHCDESEYSQVEGLNGDYFFELTRPKEAKTWKLTGAQRELEKSFPNRDMWYLILNPPLLRSTTVHNIPLRELFKEETFELKSAKRDGKDLIIEFSAKDLAWRKSVKKASGTVTLRDDANMLVQSASTTVEYEIAKAPKVIDEMLIVTYDESKGMPLVVKSVSTSQIKKGAGPAKMDTQFDLTYRDEKPSPADFPVSAFDLPEPPEQKTSQKTPK